MRAGTLTLREYGVLVRSTCENVELAWVGSAALEHGDAGGRFGGLQPTPLGPLDNNTSLRP
jgi:hypothetical protein